MGGCSSKPKTSDFGVFEMREETFEHETPVKLVDTERIGLDGALNGKYREQRYLEGTLENGLLQDQYDDLIKSSEEPYAAAQRTSEIQSGNSMSIFRNLSVENNKDPVAQHRDNRCKEEARIIALHESVFAEDIELRLHMIPFDEPRKNTTVLESQKLRTPILDASLRERSKIGILELESQGIQNGTRRQFAKSESKEAVHGAGGLRSINHVERRIFIDKIKFLNITVAAGMLGIHTRQNVKEVLPLRLKSTSMPHQEGQGFVISCAQEVHGNGALTEPNNELKEISSFRTPLIVSCRPNFIKQSGNDKSLVPRENRNVKGDAIGNRNDAQSFQTDVRDRDFHKELMQVKNVDRQGNTFEFAEGYTLHDERIPRDLLPLNNELQNDLTAEAVYHESWHVLEKDVFNDSDSLVMVSDEPKQTDTQNNGNNFALEIQGVVAVHDDEIFSTSEKLVDLKVQVPSESKLGAHCLHSFDPVSLDFNHKSVEDASAPDIDEILERLASEFERQERLACSSL